MSIVNNQTLGLLFNSYLPRLLPHFLISRAKALRFIAMKYGVPQYLNILPGDLRHPHEIKHISLYSELARTYKFHEHNCSFQIFFCKCLDKYNFLLCCFTVMNYSDGFAAAKLAFPSWNRWIGWGYVNLSTTQCCLLLLALVWESSWPLMSPHLCQVLFSRLCWPHKLVMGSFPYFLYSENDIISSWILAVILWWPLLIWRYQ